MRTMIDCTHLNVGVVRNKFPDPQMVGAYVTGSPDIRWTPADLNAFPLSTVVVTIDQGFTGSPVATATVRDVESGAWNAVAATDRVGWNALRPTIYCSADSIPDVLRAGWTGDVWLAIPSGSAPLVPPSVAGCNVVAVQWAFPQDYDVSVVFDPYWPRKAPVTKPPVVKGTDMVVIKVTGSPNVYLLSSAGVHHIVSPADESAFASVLPVVTVSPAQFAELSGGSKP